MKKILFVVSLLCSTAAFAQYNTIGGTRSTEPSILQAPSHPQHAGYSYISSGSSVLASASYASAQGDRPASDFPQPDEISLGVAARELKKQHDLMKKSRVVYVNQ